MPENIVLIISKEKDNKLSCNFNGSEDMAFRVVSLLLEGVAKAKLSNGAGILTLREEMYIRMANITTGAFDAAVDVYNKEKENA